MTDLSSAAEKLRRKRLLSGVVFWVLVFIVLFFVFEAVFGDKLEKGETLPDRSVTLSGKAYDISLSELCEEKPVLLVFVSPGCYACKVQLAVLAHTLKGDGYGVYVVTPDSGGWLSKEFDEIGSSFPVVEDKDMELHGDFQVAFYPTSALLDTERGLVYRERGVTQDLAREIESLLREY